MKRRKSLLFIGAAVLCSLPLGSKADFSGFVEQLRQSNIPINKILSQTGISRYEITRLLNATECKDCVNPDISYIKKYSEKYWSSFTAKPGQYFDDIAYQAAQYKQKSYYYCVAYVGENGYMKGYPRETSPICAGEFCGTRLATKAEFLQIVMNIIGKYVYSLYALDWNSAKNWIASLDQNGYQYKNFSSTQIDIIYDKAKTCKTSSCVLENTNELNIYLKYCMFNLANCGMNKVGKIGEGSWPVAELNLLQRQQIINLSEAEKFEIGSLIDGALVINIFSKVNDIVGCIFDDDYDCDGISNSKDTCPNSYNPHQRDTDKDNIGDVCDDDIDGDSIKNPIGIVDDNGRIVIGLWDNKQDNCLFVVNTDQKQTYSTILGDACTSSENLSLSIALNYIEAQNKKTVEFSALYKQDFSQYLWDFGDGSIGSGKNIQHTYTKEGLYSIRLIAKTKNGKQSIAKATVAIGQEIENKIAFQSIVKTISIKEDSSLKISLSEIGDIDYYHWTFGDGKIQETTDTSIQKVFRSGGNIPITIKGYVKQQVVSANRFTIAVGTNAKGAILQSSLLNPNKGDVIYFTTTIAGFFPQDVRSVDRDFGDGQTMKTTSLNTSYTYKISGKKAVVQLITLSDGTILRNIITLYVTRPYQFSSFTLSLNTPNIGTTLIPSSFSTKINGSFDEPIYFIANYGDGKSQKFGTKNIRSPFTSQHQYTNASVSYPQVNMMLDVCTTLSAQSTIDIEGSDICLDAKINGLLKNLGCDMDHDGIPDICDQDIDGDGKPNLLGLINNPKQCNYNTQLQQDKTNGNSAGNNINTDILTLHFQGVCSLDNDPFNYNIDQIDLNNNNIGDSLDSVLSQTGSSNNNSIDTFLDTDNDTIPDSQDICPLLAETYNGVTDSDGCPEIGVELGCENSRFPSISDGIGNYEDGSCGDGKIGQNETCQTCPSDAGVCSPNCGNKKIDNGETCQNCPSDVGTCISVCGNGIQEAGENCQNCPSDVGICQPNCNNGKVDNGETCQSCPSDVGACISVCGNGIQEVGETCQNCPSDVKSCSTQCGNGKIDNGETCQTCPVDVKSCISACGNGIQEVGETCQNCPNDVKSCSTKCGNGIQEVGETCQNCPSDAKYCDLNCSNGKIDDGETCQTCPVDVQRCFSACGNGIQEVGETCQNCPNDSKYCNPNCSNGEIDDGETCQTCPVDVQRCFSACGNGIIENNLGEQCDNGIVNNGKDGLCSSTCFFMSISSCENGKIDDGETCQTCPSDVQACFSNCGNKKIESELGEQCDNGIVNNGKDGLCSISCKIVGDNNCGNGVQDLGEDCLTCPLDSPNCLIIATKECNQCPCPFADFSAALNNGDQIKAVLWDINKVYPWRYSIAYEVGY